MTGLYHWTIYECQRNMEIYQLWWVPYDRLSWVGRWPLQTSHLTCVDCNLAHQTTWGKKSSNIKKGYHATSRKISCNIKKDSCDIEEDIMQYQERYYGLSRKILWTIKKDIIQYQERYHAISRKILYNIKKGKSKIKRNKKRLN